MVDILEIDTDKKVSYPSLKSNSNYDEKTFSVRTIMKI